MTLSQWQRNEVENRNAAMYARCHTLTVNGRREAFPHICCAPDCPAKPYTGGLAGALGSDASGESGASDV
jgi:hypothetical protein